MKPFILMHHKVALSYKLCGVESLEMTSPVKNKRFRTVINVMEGAAAWAKRANVKFKRHHSRHRNINSTESKRQLPSTSAYSLAEDSDTSVRISHWDIYSVSSQSLTDSFASHVSKGGRHKRAHTPKVRMATTDKLFGESRKMEVVKICLEYVKQIISLSFYFYSFIHVILFDPVAFIAVCYLCH